MHCVFKATDIHKSIPEPYCIVCTYLVFQCAEISLMTAADRAIGDASALTLDTDASTLDFAAWSSIFCCT